MCNKKYIEFSADNTVEVISMSGVQEGYDKKDKKAEEYEIKEFGEIVKYLVEFPGLTVKDMVDLNSGKAASFNTTGKTPYTSMIDPWTESEVKGWSGGSVSSGAIQDAVLEWRKTAIKEHGKGFARKNWYILTSVEREVKFYVEKNDLAKAKISLDKVKPKTTKWPDEIKARFNKLYELLPK